MPSQAQIEHFRFKTDVAVGRYASLATGLIFGPRLAEVYIPYLLTLHQIVRATVPLMRAGAAEAARRLAAGDETCRGIPEYYSMHADEETQHVEWLLEDLAVMGVPTAEVLRRQPSPDVAALVGSQYYWIYHFHPGFLLAYMVVMECYPLDISDIDLFRERTGFPEAAFRTMLVHARLDPGHGRDLYRFMENSALSDEVFDGLASCSISTCAHLTRIFSDLAATPSA